MQRYVILYDEAAKDYREACKSKNQNDMRVWKKRLEWLDIILAQHGEIYMEKEAKEE